MNGKGRTRTSGRNTRNVTGTGKRRKCGKKGTKAERGAAVIDEGIYNMLVDIALHLERIADALEAIEGEMSE